MKFTEDQITIKPHHQARLWDSCDYFAGEIHLFHERTYFPYNVFRPVCSEQWLDGGGTEAEMTALAAKHGGKAMKQFYAEEGVDAYFLAFNDNEKAIAFCRTEDFDKLVLTLDKMR